MQDYREDRLICEQEDFGVRYKMIDWGISTSKNGWRAERSQTSAKRLVKKENKVGSRTKLFWIYLTVYYG